MLRDKRSVRSWLGIGVAAWVIVLLLSATIVEVGRRSRRGKLPVELAGLVDHPAFKGHEKEALTAFEDVFRSVRTTAQYDAFAGWHYGEFDSPTWKTDKHGYRIVPGGPAKPRGRIYMFGGSTLAGWGVGQDQSIPAQIQQQLPAYKVVSGAHGAYTTRQGVSGLARLVADRGTLDGDIVVFYDGYNDFWVGCSVGDPSRVTLFEGLLSRLYIEGRERRRESPFAPLGRALYMPVVAAYKTITGQHRPQIPRGSVCDKDPERRARIAEQFVRNWRIAKGITEQFGGHFIGFFHPALPLSKNQGKYIPAKVRAFIDRRDRAFASAQSETVAAIRGVNKPWARELSTLFDADPQAVVFLDGTHVTPLGAEIAAKAVVQALRPLLEPATPRSGDAR